MIHQNKFCSFLLNFLSLATIFFNVRYSNINLYLVYAIPNKQYLCELITKNTTKSHPLSQMLCITIYDITVLSLTHLYYRGKGNMLSFTTF